MQRMNYLYILNFREQQIMQNQNYPLQPIVQRFQPIQVQLQNSKDAKELDFKLVVLLILILFLGFLIDNHEQQYQIQLQTSFTSSPDQSNPQKPPGNSLEQNHIIKISENKQNLESLSPKKSLYTPIKTLQQTHSNPLDKKNDHMPSDSKFSGPETIKVSNLVDIQKEIPENAGKNLNLQRQQKQKEEKKRETLHRKLMQKYVEFYFWFPFFIFALIVYSCYQKQHAVNSMFIEVKKSNDIKWATICEQCAICITEMKQDDLLAVLPCSSKHMFHSGCIKEWLAVRKTCPICRSDVRYAGKTAK